MQGPTGKQLWQWANRKARQAEAQGLGTEYPTVCQAARRFSCSYQAIEDATCDPPDEAEYLGIAVAMGIPGHGYYPLEKAEQLVEAY
jgi:hypothetical protein